MSFQPSTISKQVSLAPTDSRHLTTFYLYIQFLYLIASVLLDYRKDTRVVAALHAYLLACPTSFTLKICLATTYSIQHLLLKCISICGYLINSTWKHLVNHVLVEGWCRYLLHYLQLSYSSDQFLGFKSALKAEHCQAFIYNAQLNTQKQMLFFSSLHEEGILETVIQSRLADLTQFQLLVCSHFPSWANNM